MATEERPSLRVAGRIARAFINSKLTPLFIAGALLAGTFAILMIPREEEPQIVVPMLDVFVQMPGASATEVQQRATMPMERLLREVPGVEYVYSISSPELSMLVVRFYVGTKEGRRHRQDLQQAVLKLRPHTGWRFAPAHQGALN